MEQSSFDPRLEAAPAQWLEALAVRVKLHRLEWRVLAIVLSSPVPVTAPSLAKRFHLDYGLVKRVVRDRALHALRTWLDSWAGIGHVAVGMDRQGYDLQLTQYDD